MTAALGLWLVALASLGAAASWRAGHPAGGGVHARRPDRGGDPRAGHRVLPGAGGTGTRTARATARSSPRLYLQRARETGEFDDLVRAEETRPALARDPARPERRGLRACWPSSLMAQHRFARGARGARRPARRSTRPRSRARGARGGDRARAGPLRRGAARLRHARDLGASSRRSPRAGPVGGAAWTRRRRRGGCCARRAPSFAARHGMPTEQLAWFQLRLGDLALRNGRLDEAEAELERGARPRAGGLPAARRRGAARDAARDDGRRAGDVGERAIARTLDPGDARPAARRRRRAGRHAAGCGVRPARWRSRCSRSRARCTARGACSSSTTTARSPRCWQRARAEIADATGRLRLGPARVGALPGRAATPRAAAAMPTRSALGTRDAVLEYPRRHDRPRGRRRRGGAARTSRPRWGSIPTGTRRSPPRRRAVLDSLRARQGDDERRPRRFVAAGLPPHHRSGGDGPPAVPRRARGDLSGARVARRGSG